MKTIKNLRIGVILSLLFFLSQNIFANNFILSDDGLIDPRAKEKITQMGLESKEKLDKRPLFSYFVLSNSLFINGTFLFLIVLF